MNRYTRKCARDQRGDMRGASDAENLIWQANQSAAYFGKFINLAHLRQELWTT